MPTDTSTRNATLSLSNYEQVEAVSPVETRRFWDRSSNWEDPHEQNITVASRAYAYRTTDGNATAVVYTTPKHPYASPDRIRSYAAPALAELATRSISVRSLGNESGPSYRASLLDATVTVRTVVDGAGTTTAHVARVTDDGRIVVVVVTGSVDSDTVERVLDGVTLSRPSSNADGSASV